MLIDTHCHLNLHPLSRNWGEYAAKAYLAGVEKIIVPGANVESSQTAVEIAQNNETSADITAAVGIHPEEVTEASTQESLDAKLNAVSQLCREKQVVGIGEIGLDYHYHPYSEASVNFQKYIFTEQLSLAKTFGLPVCIHTRRSQAIHDACSCIQTVYGSQKFRGVFHCFTGTKSHYERIRQLGAYIGIGGLITYGHNQSLRQVIQAIPIEKIILETDAPWLTPHPKKAELNEPAYIPYIALKLAEVQSRSLSAISYATTNNALELFYG